MANFQALAVALKLKESALLNSETGLANIPGTTANGVPAGTPGNGKLYAFGNYYSTSTLFVREYTVATNTWATRTTQLPEERGYGWAAPLNGYLHLLGGGQTAVNMNKSYLYDHTTVDGTFTAKAAIPGATRTEFPVVTVNGKAYIFGGRYSAGGYSDLVYMYDPASNTWTQKASLPSQRYRLAAWAVDGKIILAGGSDNTGAQAYTVWQYDPVTDTYTQRANCPFSVTGLGNSCDVLNGKCYRAVVTSLLEYNPAADTWRRIFGKLLSAEGNTIAYNSLLYVLGGISATTTAGAYDPKPSPTWDTLVGLILAGG